jgi:hypothetical protein
MFIILKKIHNKNFVQQSYLILFVILFGSIFTLYSCLTTDWFHVSRICSLWLKDFSLNLTAELVGILLVVFSVNKAVTFRQQQENNKFKEIAFRQLRFVLTKQLYLLLEMFQTTKECPDDMNYQSLPDFLQDDAYFLGVHRLNLLDLAPVLTSDGEKMDWLDYLHSELLNLKSAINQVVDRYSFYLDSEVVDLMENLSDAVFIRFISSVWQAKKLDAYGEHGDLLSNCDELLREYIHGLLTLVDFYNESVTSERQIDLDWPTWNHWLEKNCRSQLGDLGDLGGDRVQD